MVAPRDPITLCLQQIEGAKASYIASETNFTNAVLDAARCILTAGGQEQNGLQAYAGKQNEKPGDALYRLMWSEVSGTEA